MGFFLIAGKEFYYGQEPERPGMRQGYLPEKGRFIQRKICKLTG